ncbi:hypothetical protein [Nocardia wallacei]|uniref:Uncharacterized protein n=1 Tax=Nocardia wallacei TaxID=480035 RepID=A0A7G1KM10_9NOCA|nr:hypothetical protein [Nocardia wallacei]BCK56198.1 hypothetical protein NWFMUON74_39700 [Nocardia wallacei]
MGDDDQLGFAIEFDEKTQAFLEWVEPALMESKVRAFLTDTVPGIADYASDAWWASPLLVRILEAAVDRFGDWAGFLSPDQRECADQLVRFLGECCLRQHPGMAWANRPADAACPPLYADFGPVVHFPESGAGEAPVSLAEELFMKNYGPRMVEYSIQKAGTAV